MLNASSVKNGVAVLNGELRSVLSERCGEALGTRGEVTDLVEPDLVLAQVDGKGLLNLASRADIEEAEGFLVIVDGDLTDACGAFLSESNADFRDLVTVDVDPFGGLVVVANLPCGIAFPRALFFYGDIKVLEAVAVAVASEVAREHIDHAHLLWLWESQLDPGLGIIFCRQPAGGIADKAIDGERGWAFRALATGGRGGFSGMIELLGMDQGAE